MATIHAVVSAALRVSQAASLCNTGSTCWAAIRRRAVRTSAGAIITRHATGHRAMTIRVLIADDPVERTSASVALPFGSHRPARPSVEGHQAGRCSCFPPTLEL
jgi:hypothetical protein